MKHAICTLFEGSYDQGVAALVNSLHKAGFSGRVYAGYRGVRPSWAAAANPVTLARWPGASVMDVVPGLSLAFLPLDTTHHLTNYKPEFMLDLLDGPAASADALFYLDPDICVTAPWSYFEQWVDCGVALCEDLNSPLPEHHPRRVGWRRYYAPRGLTLRFRSPEYVNGGFVGVVARDRRFLEVWLQTINLMADEVGSLAAASIAAGKAYRSKGFAGCFDTTDQDALNAAIEACAVPVSVIGQEAMGFKPGPALLPHAVGAHKPWQRDYLGFALRGVAPRLADKAFWAHVASPIAVKSSFDRACKGLEVAVASAIGRFVRRA